MEKLDIKSFFKNYIFNNFHLKILSLFVAFLLWLNISAKEVKRVEVISRVAVKNPPKNLIIEKIEPAQVKIILEARRVYLASAPSTNIEAYIDGSKLKAGENEMPVLIDKLSLNENISIVSINPDSVVVVVAKPKPPKQEKKQNPRGRRRR